MYILGTIFRVSVKSEAKQNSKHGVHFSSTAQPPFMSTLHQSGELQQEQQNLHWVVRCGDTGLLESHTW